MLSRRLFLCLRLFPCSMDVLVHVACLHWLLAAQGKHLTHLWLDTAMTVRCPALGLDLQEVAIVALLCPRLRCCSSASSFTFSRVRPGSSPPPLSPVFALLLHCPELERLEMRLPLSKQSLSDYLAMHHELLAAAQAPPPSPRRALPFAAALPLRLQLAELHLDLPREADSALRQRLQKFADHLANLRHLRLSFSSIFFPDVAGFLSNLPLLETLSVEREGHIHHHESEDTPSIAALFTCLPSSLASLTLHRLLPVDFAAVFAKEQRFPASLAELDVSFVDWPWRGFPSHHEDTFYLFLGSLQQRPRCRLRACAGLQVRDDTVLFTVCEA